MDNENYFKDMPSDVAYVMISGQLYIDTVEKYPQYFPKEYAYRKKWNSIPQSVKDAYWEEISAFKTELWKDEPKSPGLMGCVNETEEYKKWNEAYFRLRPIEKAKEEELNKKHYGPYGL